MKLSYDKKEKRIVFDGDRGTDILYTKSNRCIEYDNKSLPKRLNVLITRWEIVNIKDINFLTKIKTVIEFAKWVFKKNVLKELKE